jgi:phosphopantothenoylcysteine decarboxylase / phosphopantothenate---cysteine ligase
LDMIAANQVGGGLGFETADNALTLYWADGAVELPRAAKPELARQLIARVAERFRAARG